MRGQDDPEDGDVATARDEEYGDDADDGDVDTGAADADIPARAAGAEVIAATDAADVAAARRRQRIKSRNRAVVEWVVAIGLAVVAALCIKTWLVQAFIIPSQSMEDTLEVGDRVLVSKFAFQISDIGRGDVIVFDNPDRLPNEPAQLIKRVVALGGDTVEAADGRLLVNGVVVDEDYLRAGVITTDVAPTTVPDGTVFVMGDNRANSRDSRYIGPVDEDLVVGKAFLRIWPPGRIGTL